MTRTEVRAMTEGILDHGKPGEFLMRDKSDEPDCYALSVKADADGNLNTYLVEYNQDPKEPGYKIRGSNMVFKSIARLVAHYIKELREDVGMKLRVPGDYMSVYTSGNFNTKAAQKAEVIRRASIVRKKPTTKGMSQAKMEEAAIAEEVGSEALYAMASPLDIAEEQVGGFGVEDFSQEPQYAMASPDAPADYSQEPQYAMASPDAPADYSQEPQYAMASHDAPADYSQEPQYAMASHDAPADYSQEPQYAMASPDELGGFGDDGGGAYPAADGVVAGSDQSAYAFVSPGGIEQASGDPEEEGFYNNMVPDNDDDFGGFD
jgi:hypothetical protein